MGSLASRLGYCGQRVWGANSFWRKRDTGPAQPALPAGRAGSLISYSSIGWAVLARVGSESIDTTARASCVFSAVHHDSAASPLLEPASSGRVLITDGDDRAALAAARSLVAGGWDDPVTAPPRPSLVGVAPGGPGWSPPSEAFTAP